MSDFWAKKLGQPTTQERPQINSPEVGVPVSQGPWWRPQQQPQAPYAAPVATVPNAVTETATVGEALALVVDPRLTKATSARSTDSCPSCGSTNYTGGFGANEMKHCFECGHNARFTQQAGGISGDSSGPAQPARQLPSGGYNPQTVIGRIG